MRTDTNNIGPAPGTYNQPQNGKLFDRVAFHS